MKVNIKIDLVKVTSIIFAIISVISLQPYFVWNNKYVVYAICFLCMLLFIILYKMSAKNFDKKDILLVILYVIVIYFNASIDNIKILFGIFFLQIPVVVFLLGDNEFKINTYKYFVKLFALSLIPGIIIFVFNLLGVDFSHTLIEPLNALKNGYYKCYYGAVVFASNVESYGGILFTRLCGMYDEPGVPGTICGIILMIEKLDFKKNHINKILLIGGLLSFSMAFYILLLINMLVNRKFKFFVFIILVLTVLNFSSFNKQYGVFDKILFERIMISDFKLSGDNRTSSTLDYAYDHFLSSDLATILMGKGQGYVRDHVDDGGSSSYKILIFERGLIFFILYLLLIALFYYKNTNSFKNYYILLAIYLSIYQRPDILILAYVVLIVGGTLSNSSEEELAEKLQIQEGDMNTLDGQQNNLTLTPNQFR